MASCVMLGAVHTGNATILAWTACQMKSSSALWDTMAPMVLRLMAGWGMAFNCNFTDEETKQYSGEQGL